MYRFRRVLETVIAPECAGSRNVCLDTYWRITRTPSHVPPYTRNVPKNRVLPDTSFTQKFGDLKRVFHLSLTFFHV